MARSYSHITDSIRKEVREDIMFNKILVANRGEIAVRIIRACKEMGIKTVAIFSEADRESMHVKMADQAVCVGGPQAKDSYLNVFNILSATLETKSQAIHTGYGLLSENSKFAGMCKSCGIKFIGPSVENMNLLGNKLNARLTMIKAGVPVIPGSDGLLESVEHARECAGNIGYPVMLKAANGGGGRGIRKVDSEEDLVAAYNNAKKEAKACFGEDSLYMEKFMDSTRHIEFQVLADEYGNVIHLGERDCTIQRNNQKMIEEAPSCALSPKLRDEMGKASVRAAKESNYINAGTVEFLLDNHNHFYFMEMNTRIQVEHPVTEFITHIDLIKKQIEIAYGMQLGIEQKHINLIGHSMECRINAEDPSKGFAPCCGKVQALHVPGGPGVRFDSMLYQDYVVPQYYDSMVGKLIVHAPTRESCIEKMRNTLMEFKLEGFKTNVEYLEEILNDEIFIKGVYDTSYISKRTSKPKE